MTPERVLPTGKEEKGYFGLSASELRVEASKEPDVAALQKIREAIQLNMELYPQESHQWNEWYEARNFVTDEIVNRTQKREDSIGTRADTSDSRQNYSGLI